MLLSFLLAWPAPATARQDAGAAAADTTVLGELTAGEADGERLRRDLLPGTDGDLGFTTLHIGAGFLFDVAGFVQDEESEQQVTIDEGFKIRDFRLLANGRFATERPATWQIGVMYDGVNTEWLIRQSGLMVAVPEIFGNLFLGRAKEGYSQSKVMTGYDLMWTERFTFTDATVPILADGLKWLGFLPEQRVFWNFGVFSDLLSEDATYATYDNQVALRFGWVPMESDSIGKLLHLGVNLRTGQVDNDELQLRARPESNVAPYYLDTGTFPATSTRMAGFETFYRPGALVFALEYHWQFIDSPETGDPVVHGGDVTASWAITGETRGYNRVGGYFKTLSPARTVFEGGPGAVEAVFRFSYSDLDDGGVRGGRFWRVTPMVNWYLTDQTRLEFVYGFGVLHRFDVSGSTHFFQTRFQLRF